MRARTREYVRPVRRHLPLLIPLLAAAVFGLVSWIQDCTLGAARFDVAGFGITFEYPDDLQLRRNPGAGQVLAAEPDRAVALVRNPGNRIIVASYALNRAVTEANLDSAERRLDRSVATADRGVGSGRRVDVAGFPGFEYRISGARTQGAGLRYTAFFVEDTKYVIACQSSPERRNEIRALCERALVTMDTTAERRSIQ